MISPELIQLGAMVGAAIAAAALAFAVAYPYVSGDLATEKRVKGVT